MMCRVLLLSPLLMALALAGASDKSQRRIDAEPLKKWMSQQANMRTLSADFRQTRKLRVLRDPVVKSGRVWFSAPRAFRWEIGMPPEIIALRKNGSIFLIFEKEKKATHFDAETLGERAGARNLGMMDFPMAVSYADFEQRFEVLDLTVTGNRCDLDILPRDRSARKYLQRIRLSFNTDSGDLLVFEIDFRDGSALQNEFSNIQVNRELDVNIFDFDFTGFTVTDE
jgi:outer membrane lipoprotein carrier protein